MAGSEEQGRIEVLQTKVRRVDVVGKETLGETLQACNAVVGCIVDFERRKSGDELW